MIKITSASPDWVQSNWAGPIPALITTKETPPIAPITAANDERGTS